MGKNVVIVIALLAAGFFGAYLRFRPYLGLEAAYTDGVRTYDSVNGDEAIRFAVWDEALPLPEGVNSAQDEQRPALSPDGELMVFVSGEGGLNADLFVARVVNGQTLTARPLHELNTDLDELAPAFSHNALYFASNRPGGEGGLDIWRAPYEDGTFGAPELVRGGLNTEFDESDPAPIAGSRVMAFASNRESDWNLFLARPKTIPVGTAASEEQTGWRIESLAAVNSLHDEREPAFTANGLGLVLASNHPGGSGGFDLWRSVREDGEWLPAEPIQGVGTAADERGPLPSRDGFTLYFSRSGGGASADLFRAESRELFRLPGKPVGWLDLLILTSLALLALLAWLAKRWQQLEILYKCFLASVAVHFAMLLWFQGVGVESSSAELPDRSALFQVRLASTNAIASRALEERSGQLESTKMPREMDSEGPQRMGTEVAVSEPRTRVEAAIVPSRGIEAQAPQRGGISAPQPGVRAQVEIATVERDEPQRRLELGARKLELSARELPNGHQSVALTQPQRLATARADTESDSAAQGEPFTSIEPVEVALTRGQSESTAQSAPARASAPVAPEPVAMRARNLELAFAEPAELPRRVNELAEGRGQPLDMSSRTPVLALEATVVAFDRTQSSVEPRRFRPESAITIPVAPPLKNIVAVRREPREFEHRKADRLEQTPYRSRFGLEKERALNEHGGGEETELAVERGLGYLAGIQNQTGSWGNPDYETDKYFEVGIGKTGLALLAFLGAGHTPDSETRYSDLTHRAVDYLLTRQDSGSGHFGYSASYSHAISTYALAECYALTEAQKLRAPLESAVAHILDRQLEGGGQRGGGWGYYYPDERGSDGWPRVSVSSWQVMALESARLGGLDVPTRAFRGARQFLERSQDRSGWFRYSHDPARLNSAYATLPGSTPAALFALSLLGEDLTSSRWNEAIEFVTERAPDGYRYTSDDAFVYRARGNLYFWYYSTLVLFRHGEPKWDRWNTAMKETLLGAQARDGSWRPISIYAQYAGDTEQDRSYSTAMSVLTLEIYYRYFTPLLKVE